MKINELIEKLQDFRLHLLRGASDLAIIIGQNALAQIRQRVIESGKNAQGNEFGQYSTKDILVNYTTFIKAGAYNKVAGSKAKRKKLEWKKVYNTTLGRYVSLFKLDGGYKKIRELEGRQTDFINFFRTGGMWFSIRPDIIEQTSQKIVIELAARTLDGQLKLAKMTARFGRILEVSEAEQNILNGIIKNYVLDCAQKAGLILK